MFIKRFYLPPCKLKGLQALEYHPSALDTVEDTAAIHVNPKSHMNGVTALAKKSHIAFLWDGYRFPMLSFRVFIDGINQGSQVPFLHRNDLQCFSIAATIHIHHQPPAIKGLRPITCRFPGFSNIIKGPMCFDTQCLDTQCHRVSPGKRFAL